MNESEYRAAHQLARGLSLRAAALNERAREQGRVRYTERPAIRQAMAVGRTRIDPATSRTGSAETAHFHTTLQARSRGGWGKQAAARAAIDVAAQRNGHPTIEEYLADRIGQGATVSFMARELRVGRATVNRRRDIARG